MFVISCKIFYGCVIIAVRRFQFKTNVYSARNTKASPHLWVKRLELKHFQFA